MGEKINAATKYRNGSRYGGMIGTLYSVDARFKKQRRKGKQKQKAVGAVRGWT